MPDVPGPGCRQLGAEPLQHCFEDVWGIWEGGFGGGQARPSQRPLTDRVVESRSVSVHGSGLLTSCRCPTAHGVLQRQTDDNERLSFWPPTIARGSLHRTEANRRSSASSLGQLPSHCHDRLCYVRAELIFRSRAAADSCHSRHERAPESLNGCTCARW